MKGLLSKLRKLFASDKVDLGMRFELLTEGLSGTMSRFHRARDRKSDRTVGLKILDSEKTAIFEGRFETLKKPQEGQIAESFHNEQIVTTLEHGVSTKGQGFIVMEYLDGPGLHILIREKDQRLVGNRVPLIRQMAEAIKTVHNQGYIHRDICPRNFIASSDLQTVKLIDFGLTLPDTPNFRQPGNRTGTPMYMAPEIVRRRDTDRRVDVFAFGVTAYELLTFQLPWPHADSTGQGALSHDTDAHVPILELRPNLDKRLASAVTDCMAANRDHRPKNMEAFLQRITGIDNEEE